MGGQRAIAVAPGIVGDDAVLDRREMSRRDTDPATAGCGAISGDSAAAHCERTGGDAANGVCAFISSDGAVVDRQFAERENARSDVIGAIRADGAVVDSQRSRVVDAPATTQPGFRGCCCVVHDGAVGDLQRPLVPDSGTKGCFSVLDGEVRKTDVDTRSNTYDRSGPAAIDNRDSCTRADQVEADSNNQVFCILRTGNCDRVAGCN